MFLVPTDEVYELGIQTTDRYQAPSRAAVPPRRSASPPRWRSASSVRASPDPSRRDRPHSCRTGQDRTVSAQSQFTSCRTGQDRTVSKTGDGTGQ